MCWSEDSHLTYRKVNEKKSNYEKYNKCSLGLIVPVSQRFFTGGLGFELFSEMCHEATALMVRCSLQLQFRPGGPDLDQPPSGVGARGNCAKSSA